MKSVDDDMAFWKAQSDRARSKQAALFAFGAYAALRIAKEDYMGKVYSSEGCADAMVADGYASEQRNPEENSVLGSALFGMTEAAAEVGRLQKENEGLRADVDRLAQSGEEANQLYLKMCSERERLRAALSWIEDQDPQIVDAARTKFGIDKR